MEELFTLIAKSYGLVGLVLLSPFVAMVFLWRNNQELHKELAAANEKIGAVKDQRVEDAKEVAASLLKMTAEHAALSKETNMALERVGDLLTVMQNSRYSGRSGS